jgi:putative ABC transport system ATP-binding protein
MVMGPSGSGKSTLVAALSGLLRPDEGEVTALGQNIWDLRDGKIDRFRLDHCGFIFQGFNLFPALTAVQQVEIILKYQGRDKAEARPGRHRAGGGRPRPAHQPAADRSCPAARSSGSPSPARWPSTRACCSPTSRPRPSTARTARSSSPAAARRQEHNGAAVICVTHDPRLEAYADRIIHIEDGRILDDRPRAAAPDAAPHKPDLIGA